jgi:hypothetical protein
MKNPWMSLWLSAANQAAGAARSAWFAEAERQRQAYVRQMTKAWAEAMTPPALRPDPKRRRKPH